MAQSDTIAYAVVEGWEQLPTGYAHRDVAGVAGGGGGRVDPFFRGGHPGIVYDQQGKFFRSWGEGAVPAPPPGVFVGPHSTLFCPGDGDHTGPQLTPEA